VLCAGFDLSFTRSAGVWLDHDFKLIQTWSRSFPPGPKRLAVILRSFASELQACKPDLVVVEDNAFGAANRVVVVKLSQLNTLLKTVCEVKAIDWLEVSPSMLKKELTGKGTAEKSQVAQEIKRLYGLEFRNDPGNDISDACAAAIWGVRQRQGRRR